MSDTKKLMEDFDTVCQCARAWLVENGKDELWIDSHSTEIKGIVEYYEKFEGKIKEIMASKAPTPPGDDLVEKIVSICDQHTWVKEFKKAEIRALLQGRPEKPDIVHHEVGKGGGIKVPFPLLKQPEKLRVTEREIRRIASRMQRNSTDVWILRDWLKSKGLEVVEK